MGVGNMRVPVLVCVCVWVGTFICLCLFAKGTALGMTQFNHRLLIHYPIPLIPYAYQVLE